MKVAALALIPGFAAAHEGYAQEYPAKPIRLIISSSPGSGVDTIARAVAQRMSELLGVQTIPDNRAGGGSTIGVQYEMFSHIMVGSNDIARSKRIYDALFVAMGAKPGVEDAKGGSYIRTMAGVSWCPDPSTASRPSRPMGVRSASL